MGEIVLKQPGVENAVAFPGLSINGFTNSSNAGIVFATLQPFDERKGADLSGGAIAGALNQQFAAHPGRVHRDLPAAAGAGAGHHRRLQAAARGPRLARLRGARRGDQGLHGQGLPGARARRHVLQLPGQRAAALRRHRPHQGAPARRAGDRGVRHDADLPRQPVRERLQQVRPHLLGARAGRCGVPRARRGRRPAQGALEHRRDGAALGADERAQRRGPGARDALQRLPRRRHQRQRRARLLLRPGAGRDRAHRRRDAAAGHRLRVDRAHLPGDPRRQLGDLGLPARDPARVPGARRAVREPGAAARDHPRSCR